MLLALLVVSLGSCQEKAIYATFNTEYEFEAKIPPTTGISLPFELFTTEQESNFESQYSINDTRKDLVSEVELTGFTIQIVDPQGKSFSFLQSVAFYIDSNDDPEAKIAEKDPVPDTTGNELILDVFSSNLAPYIKSDDFIIRMNAVTDETISNEITVRGVVNFRIRARVIGG